MVNFGAYQLDGATVGTTTLVQALQARALGVASIATLRAAAYAVLSNQQIVEVACYSTAGDAGGGRFVWSATSTAADDGLSIINPTGNTGAGRYLRVFQGGFVTPSMAGARADYSTNDTAAVQAVVTFAVANGMKVLLDRPRYLVTTISVPSDILIEGLGRDATMIQRYQGGDIPVTATSGGTLPSGTYYVVVLAYNGSTFLSAQVNTSTVLASPNGTLTGSYSAVSTATSYVIYFTSGASLFGTATYSVANGTALTFSIAALPTATTTCPVYVDPVLNVAVDAKAFRMSELTVNANYRASHAVYSADYTGSGSPYEYSVVADHCAVLGALYSSFYFGNREFASQLIDVNISGGWNAGELTGGADHFWFNVGITQGVNTNLFLSGQQVAEFHGCSIFKGQSTSVQLGNYCFGVKFIGGSIDTNPLYGVTIDPTCSATIFDGVRFANPGATAHAFVQGKQTLFDKCIWESDSNGSVQYCIFADMSSAGAVDVIYSINALFPNVGGGSSVPYSTAFTNAPSLLSGSTLAVPPNELVGTDSSGNAAAVALGGNLTIAGGVLSGTPLAYTIASLNALTNEVAFAKFYRVTNGTASNVSPYAYYDGAAFRWLSNGAVVS